MLLTTISPEGEPTISPKGGQAGFVGVNGNTLYLPDMRGNNLIFSLQNIVTNPQVGAIFLVPGKCETLRLHGRAFVSADETLCQQYPIGKKPARLVTMIEVESAYFHCSSSLKTSGIWDTESWGDRFKISFRTEILPNLPEEMLK